jgi:ATP adenylyltransferase/5',5'''-P-1,P-4-tetraphosphate phosphorylase II
MIDLGHLVISSADPRATQEEHLNLSDCHALSQLITGTDGKGLAYYNCGLETGCSQMHKHMQYAPLTHNPVFEAMKRGVTLPWRYFTRRLGDFQPADILKAYRECLEAAKHKGSYNVAIADGVLAMVPRRLSYHAWGVSLNALGVCGHIFAYEDGNQLVEQKPFQLFTDLCVPV